MAELKSSEFKQQGLAGLELPPQVKKQPAEAIPNGKAISPQETIVSQQEVPELEGENIATHYLLKGGRVIAPVGPVRRTGTVEDERTLVQQLQGQKVDGIPAYKLLDSITLYMGHAGDYKGVKSKSVIGVHGDYALVKRKISKNDTATSEER